MDSPIRKAPQIPSKDDLLAFIGQQTGKVGTREIARAFGLKNADRVVLNTAAWLAFWEWSLGRASRTWKKIAYAPAEKARPEPAADITLGAERSLAVPHHS